MAVKVQRVRRGRPAPDFRVGVLLLGAAIQISLHIKGFQPISRSTGFPPTAREFAETQFLAVE